MKNCIIMLYIIKINTLTLSEFGDSMNTLKGKKKKVIFSFHLYLSLKKGDTAKYMEKYHYLLF